MRFAPLLRRALAFAFGALPDSFRRPPLPLYGARWPLASVVPFLIQEGGRRCLRVGCWRALPDSFRRPPLAFAARCKSRRAVAYLLAISRRLIHSGAPLWLLAVAFLIHSGRRRPSVVIVFRKAAARCLCVGCCLRLRPLAAVGFGCWLRLVQARRRWPLPLARCLIHSGRRLCRCLRMGKKRKNYIRTL